MKTAELKFAVATLASVVLLAACGIGSAPKDAAGTLMEAKQSTAEAQPAVATDAAAADQAAAADAAKAPTEVDPAGAAKASSKDGDRTNGIAQCANC